MKHFGTLCPLGAGHLNNFMVLADEPQTRGHRVTLFGLPDVREYAIAPQLNFCPISEENYSQEMHCG